MNVGNRLSTTRWILPGFWRTLVDIPVVWLRLRSSRFRTEIFQSHQETRTLASPTCIEEVKQLNRILSRVPVASNCLIRAVLLQRYLRRRGLEGRVTVGFREKAAVFAAHAWIEFGGEAIGRGAEVLPELGVTKSPLCP